MQRSGAPNANNVRYLPGKYTPDDTCIGRGKNPNRRNIQYASSKVPLELRRKVCSDNQQSANIYMYGYMRRSGAPNANNVVNQPGEYNPNYSGLGTGKIRTIGIFNTPPQRYHSNYGWKVGSDSQQSTRKYMYGSMRRSGAPTSKYRESTRRVHPQLYRSWNGKIRTTGRFNMPHQRSHLNYGRKVGSDRQQSDHRYVYGLMRRSGAPTPTT